MVSMSYKYFAPTKHDLVFWTRGKKRPGENSSH